MLWFFFQAEDGIRDLVRSRGLGDVYKRQLQEGPDGLAVGGGVHVVHGKAAALEPTLTERFEAVSYTHLTLPTSDLV